MFPPYSLVCVVHQHHSQIRRIIFSTLQHVQHQTIPRSLFRQSPPQPFLRYVRICDCITTSLLLLISLIARSFMRRLCIQARALYHPITTTMASSAPKSRCHPNTLLALSLPSMSALHTYIHTL